LQHHCDPTGITGGKRHAQEFAFMFSLPSPLGAAHARPLAARRRFVGAALGLALLAAGCSKAPPERVPVFPVQGTITFKGQPIVGGVVALHPKNDAQSQGAPLTPHGNVGPDGTFAITTYDRADGAPEGDYVLTVSWYKPVKKGADVASGPNVIPPKYGSPETSDLEVKVAAGANTLKPIQL
jgi:hypothetical protein